MKKQIITVGLIFSVIAVIGGSMYYFSLNKKTNNINKLTGQVVEEPKKDTKNALSAVKKLNCEDIKDAKAKENCSAGVIKLLNSENDSVCAGLTTEADKNACRHSYLIKATVQSGDLEKCQQAAGPALIADCEAQASFSLAIQKRDKKYCEKIINQTDKDNCFKVLAGLGVK